MQMITCNAFKRKESIASSYLHANCYFNKHLWYKQETIKKCNAFEQWESTACMCSATDQSQTALGRVPIVYGHM